MLYLIHGPDTSRGKRNLSKILSFFRSKIGNLGVFRVDGDDFKIEELEEMLKSRTLFEKKFVVACDRVLEVPEAEKFVADNIERFSSSPNVFVFFEESVGEKILGLFRRNAEKVSEFRGAPQPEEKGELFPICDAFALKDGKRLWTLFVRASLRGVPAEEIFWKVWWQMKNLLVARALSSKGEKEARAESGLHPFVLGKARRALGNFKDGELDECSARLMGVYREARSGGDMAAALEKFFLEFFGVVKSRASSSSSA